MHVLCTDYTLISVHQDAGAGIWITCGIFLQLESLKLSGKLQFVLEASAGLPCSWNTGNCAATWLTGPGNKLPGKIELLLTIVASGIYC